jgi:hypothetical protein
MSFARRLPTVTVIAVAGIAAIISILDLTGALDQVSWLKDRVPVLTLLVVGAVSAYLISEQSTASRTQEHMLDSAIKKAIESVSEIQVLAFNGRAEFWRYAAQRIRECKATIDDLTWGSAPPSAMTADDKAAYQEYRKAIALVSTGKGENKTKIFREVMSFPNDVRIHRARPLMDERYPNYHLRYYDYNHAGSPSLLQYYVFDRSEVLITSRSQAGAALDNCFMTFRSRALATIMSHYFEVIWHDAILLKDTDVVKRDLLDDIERKIAGKEAEKRKRPHWRFTSNWRHG